VADFDDRRRVMVDTQVRPSDVTKFPVIEAMLHVPREAFVPAGLREAAYAGDHLDIGGGRVMLDPRTLAKMIDLTDIRRGDVVLDVACGLGYSAAVLARLAEVVVAVEDDPARADAAQANLADQGVDNAAVMTGPLAAGAARSAPYDAIMIEGAVEEMPADLTAQLREGGRICAIFAEGGVGAVRLGLKTGGRVSWRFGFNAQAPLLPGFARVQSFAL
jgi:protein-L-isoaspartate(D-aspartate) O-methyltransferase